MAEYTEAQIERLVRAEELRAEALASLAAQLPALIEKLGQRSSWRGKKKGDDHGTYKVTPNIQGWNNNDSYKVPISGYKYNPGNGRVMFFSPYNPNGELNENGAGVVVATADPSKKNWKDQLKLDGWNFNKDGEPRTFELRIGHMIVGSSADKPDKKFSWIVKLEDPGNHDPEAINYVQEEKQAEKTEEKVS